MVINRYESLKLANEANDHGYHLLQTSGIKKNTETVLVRLRSGLNPTRYIGRCRQELHSSWSLASFHRGGSVGMPGTVLAGSFFSMFEAT